ncbi:MAG: hypothetical protein A3K19_13045 [Lentisphaerae bacterium RIFOXYB12_FULL_65_16]|nr:MAG: hypothetical protein A3K18_04660 [Lentisphaerae bacterium RIFOXYA12_64_32]OGV87237.1 MAG: hypothetical protein A3K19_13045 [Lentisphaerae bacterium RIFOXYB12_FULL_65_16]
MSGAQNLTVAIVPARAGSKGVAGKNIRIVGGHPVIAYTIAACRLSKEIDRTVVSTDSPEIADIARRYGAEVPFLRPAELARDDSGDIDYVRHAVDWLEEHEGSIPERIAQMRPTTPLRDPAVIDQGISFFKEHPDATSMRSGHEVAEPPEKMLRIRDGFFAGLFPEDPRPEYFNLPRQVFPPAYHPNGYLDIVRPEFIRRTGKLYGDRILAFVTPSAIEIDTVDDIDYLNFHVGRGGHRLLSSLDEQASLRAVRSHQES